ncbi:ABC transporter ATP-binding protein [Pseudomonas citronellolis]|uniref:ABC transporter ATP-binding protein n=1 Tax=Pseudomonas citronellolis TaxID=53408 RepID=UPI0023E4455E|nr:ABC transporter ATP-binding protein [Pseudomonas citronellolis]MDF3935311.1 ABC transporter ATP-binding protein [Pseudomonas citronellolis]
MFSEPAIRVENLSKCYHIYEKPRDRLLQMVMRGRKQYFREFWAVRGVSLEVKKGETVGIVGRNGSGKSTLLQMICGTLNQTGGVIKTNGRIAALLELGSGFNPEFTGRENIFLNATILGLTEAETTARLDEIIDFSEIGEFIDQPIKTYSSGMVVRLAFAVAVSVQPEILIVDEALSVGDELFQRKCFAKIEQIKERGATILFVSHSGSTIIELCDRAVLIDSGELLYDGPPKLVIGQYQRLLYAPQERLTELRDQLKLKARDSQAPSTPLSGQPPPVQLEVESCGETFDPNLKPSSTLEYESNGAKIHSPKILCRQGAPVNNLKRGRSYRYCYRVNFEESATNVRFGMLIKTTSGVELGGGTSSPQSSSIPYVPANSTIDVEFEFTCSLNPGVYFLNAGVVGGTNGGEFYLHRLLDVAMFRVMPETELLSTGVVDFSCQSRIEKY